jgi:hypothetical protein
MRVTLCYTLTLKKSYKTQHLKPISVFTQLYRRSFTSVNSTKNVLLPNISKQTLTKIL